MGCASSTLDKHSIERYFAVNELRKLLTFDSALGGIPVKLVRARWLFENMGDLSAVLPNRQELERECPDAFCDEAMIERLLGEVEEATVENNDMLFPGVVACSYCWLHPVHPDPNSTVGTQHKIHLEFGKPPCIS